MDVSTKKVYGIIRIVVCVVGIIGVIIGSVLFSKKITYQPKVNGMKLDAYLTTCYAEFKEDHEYLNGYKEIPEHYEPYVSTYDGSDPVIARLEYFRETIAGTIASLVNEEYEPKDVGRYLPEACSLIAGALEKRAFVNSVINFMIVFCDVLIVTLLGIVIYLSVGLIGDNEDEYFDYEGDEDLYSEDE